MGDTESLDATFPLLTPPLIAISSACGYWLYKVSSNINNAQKGVKSLQA